MSHRFRVTVYSRLQVRKTLIVQFSLRTLDTQGIYYYFKENITSVTNTRTVLETSHDRDCNIDS